ncbi:MAG: transposase [Planctomycetota bacterium]|nr:transposase [Planctomycetota bacterium]
MAKRLRLLFSPEDLKDLAQQRFEHPDPRVQQPFEVLWLISQKVIHHQAAKLAGVSQATAKRNVAIYREGGVAALRQFHWCVLVKFLAKSLNIELLFLPSCSPNLNLIERLWKFTKKKVLYGRFYDIFAAFCGAIDGCLGKIEIDHRKELKSLMTHKFQTFRNASFLAA